MIETYTEKFDDFIEVYDDVASPEFCKNVIDHYAALKETRRAFSRQESEGASPLDKTGGVAFLTDCPDLYNLDGNSRIVAEFNNLIGGCFNRYALFQRKPSGNRQQAHKTGNKSFAPAGRWRHFGSRRHSLNPWNNLSTNQIP